MKKIFVGFSILVGVLGSRALAADLPVRAGLPLRAPPPYALPFTWAGCYVGAHIGGGWGDETVSAPALAPGISVSAGTNGAIGGGQIGCNFQIAPTWVIGIEGDGAATSLKGDKTATVFGITGTAHGQTDWIASVTGRFGWAVDRWFIYGKGGAAWAGDSYSADIPVFVEHIEANETRPGWTVGAGVEWAFLQNWSAKVEYDFYDFGTRNVTFSGIIFGVPEVVPGINIKETISAVKFGVNYRFGPMAGAY